MSSSLLLSERKWENIPEIGPHTGAFKTYYQCPADYKTQEMYTRNELDEIVTTGVKICYPYTEEDEEVMSNEELRRQKREYLRKSPYIAELDRQAQSFKEPPNHNEEAPDYDPLFYHKFQNTLKKVSEDTRSLFPTLVKDYDGIGF